MSAFDSRPSKHWQIKSS